MDMNTFESKRKVVLLKGEADKWYEQAIFILRAGADENNIDFVKEAEMIMNSQALHTSIIEKYEKHAAYAPVAPLRQKPVADIAVKRPTSKGRTDFVLNVGLVVTGIALLFVFMHNFL